MIVGQGPNALAVGADGVIFTLLSLFFPPLSPSLWETVRYRLKYSRTSVARTLMARLPRLFRTRSSVPKENPLAADLG